MGKVKEDKEQEIDRQREPLSLNTTEHSPASKELE